MNTINIVYTCNSGFFYYLSVSIYSMIKSLKKDSEFNINFYIVQIDFSEDQKRTLIELVERYHKGGRVQFYDYTMVNKFSKSPYKAIEIVTLIYYLPEFFPSLDRVIFVDGDTLFFDDISSLWSSDLGNDWIATNPCVLDDESLEIYNSKTSGEYKFFEQTLNAGIMILDLQKMRERNITKILDEWTQENQSQLELPEQEAIAYNFPERRYIEHKWNWRGAIAYSEPFWTSKSEALLNDYLAIKPSMVHFQSPIRPDSDIINSYYFSAWMDHFNELGLGSLSPKRVGFWEFVYLMKDDKTTFFKRTSSLLTYLWHIPHALSCLLDYFQYSIKPNKFIFPKIKPIYE